MQDFETRVRRGQKRGIGIMLDMVFNHTSTDHPVVPESHCRRQDLPDYYIWRDGVPGTPPTNWESKFGRLGLAVEEHVGKYYLHLFDVTQADLNWENPAGPPGSVRYPAFLAAARAWTPSGLTWST